MKHKIHKKISIFFAVYMLCSCFFSTTAFAHDAYSIETLVNPSGNGYLVSVINDTHGLFAESDHIEGKIIGLSKAIGYGLEHNENVKVAAIGESFIGKGAAEKFITDMTIGGEGVTSAEYFASNGDKMPDLISEDKKGAPYMLAFPAKQQATTLGFLGSRNADEWDNKRATTIADTLSKTLNHMIALAIGGRKSLEGKKAQSIVAASILIMPDNTGNDWAETQFTGADGKKYTILYGNKLLTKNEAEQAQDSWNTYLKSLNNNTNTTISISDLKAVLPKCDTNSNLYAYAFESENGSDVKLSSVKNVSGMIWAMPKGYIKGSSDGVAINPDALRSDGESFAAAQDKTDTAWITIHMLSFYGNSAYVYYGLSTESMPPVELGMVETIISNIFTGLLNGIKAALGLYGMDELIFNEGTRSGDIYTQGLMPTSWWGIILKYYTIFHIIAWMVIGLALVKTLIQINFGTIASANSGQRAQLMETLLKMFTVGMLLVLCIPIVRLMVAVNNSLVNIFAAAYDGDMAKIPATRDVFAQILISFFYLMIFLYANFTYIMRSITLAILIAMGPLFIVSMAFFSKGKGLFDNWLKEVAANIFLQAFHAFCLSFLFEAIKFGGNGIENVVVIFSIIPITEFFREMIFGKSGGFAIETGKKLSSMALEARHGLVPSFNGLKSKENAGGSMMANSSGGMSVRGAADLKNYNSQDFKVVGGNGSDLNAASQKQATALRGGLGKEQSSNFKDSAIKGLGIVGSGIKATVGTASSLANGIMDMGQGMAFDDRNLRTRGAIQTAHTISTASTEAAGMIYNGVRRYAGGEGSGIPTIRGSALNKSQRKDLFNSTPRSTSKPIPIANRMEKGGL